MKRNTLIALGFILIICAALFYDQILAKFNGMTLLESLRFIADYLIHATVVTICGLILIGLPEIIKPWARMFRQKQKSERKLQRADGRRQTIPTPQRAPTTNRVMSYLLNQLGFVEKKPAGQPQVQEPSHIKLDM